MPHLSPVLWLMTLFLFLLVLMFFISCLWWMNLPKFNIKGTQFFLLGNNWNWS